MEKVQGRDFDFYTIRTTLNIDPTTEDGKVRHDAIVRVIEKRCNPRMVTVSGPFNETKPSDLPAAKGEVNVYFMKFALAHIGMWVYAYPTLATSLNGVLDFVYEQGANDNVSVIYHETM